MDSHHMVTRSKRQKLDVASQTEEHTDTDMVRCTADQNIILIPIHFPPQGDNDDECECDDYYTSDDECEYTPDGEEDQSRCEAYRKTLSREERAFFKTLGRREQLQMVDSEKHLSEINFNEVPIRFKVLQSHHHDQTKSIALNKLNLVKDMDSPNGESMKTMNWINNMCRIPVQKYKSLPVTSESSQQEIRDFLERTTDYFTKNIYGHHDVKKQILRILAQWISNPTSKGNVIGIHGNPGVGKTTLVKDCICKALDIPFQFIPMGGASDGSYLDGHSYTYEGSTWGKIVDCLMKSNCMNPVLYFDEIDKISDTSKGQELINILIHLTDPSQNDSFTDKYFSEFPIDLSRCLIIFTYNNDAMLNPILKDRMIRISTADYKLDDKIHIAKDFILPELYNQFRITPSDIDVSVDTIRHVISKTPSEAGVRNLKRSFELILGNINLTRMIKKENLEKYMVNIFKYNDDTDSIFPLTLTNEIVDEYIKSPLVNESHYHLYT